jgi:hypothetical protein
MRDALMCRTQAPVPQSGRRSVRPTNALDMIGGVDPFPRGRSTPGDAESADEKVGVSNKVHHLPLAELGPRGGLGLDSG